MFFFVYVEFNSTKESDSGVHIGLIHEKTKGLKSRSTIPLKCVDDLVEVVIFLYPKKYSLSLLCKSFFYIVIFN
jgi:hypothetical protein